MASMVEAYTGLSPTAFFTILALMFGVYKLVCGMFVDPDSDPDPSKKQPPPITTTTTTMEEEAPLLNKQQQPITASEGDSGDQKVEEKKGGDSDDDGLVGDLSEEQLRAYDGSDPTKPLLMAIKSQIYDVSPSRMFYGPGGPYALFAGRDASRALALMSFDSNDLTGDLDGLEPSELEVLQDWEYKFQEKYKKVGRIVAPTGNEHTSPKATGVEKQL